ncbi:MAG: DUF3800 domain-containing protein [Thermoleophilaceae bacterium]|nr:DUF3800 domain-containing protein [Thermoleophilaceae bacterium]
MFGRQTPVFVVGGIVVDASAVEPITREFIAIKIDASGTKKLRHDHDHLKQNLEEIKGSSLRRIYRHDSNPQTKTAAVLERTLALLELYEAEIVGYIRRAGSSDDAGEQTYHGAVRHICRRFNHRLAEAHDDGVVIADNRDDVRNRQLAHSMYVEKFRGTDKLPRIAESVTFGQSENHAGLQIADIVCSALLAPIAAGEENIKHRFGNRVKHLRQDVQLV